ncbi:FAD-dependent oxidoreductase [bacterium]|nr:FAD-dependent oxidoreductase [bacterium]
MAKPTLLTVDDDPEVLRSVERDLKRHYSADFRVLRAESGSAALEILKRVKERNDTVALFLVDQRMPQMDGVSFLAEAVKIFPDAKRALLTAYADTDAAIAAINRVHIHQYLLKPWDPPEENFYPILDDLIEDWHANYRPPFQGIRVLGNRWSPHSHTVKYFLARYNLPYRWLDIETKDRDTEVRSLVDVLDEIELQKLPLVLFPDGSKLCAPSPGEIADRIGLLTRAETDFYDLVIIGGGPSGLAAAVYGASEGLRTVMIEREAPGGQAALSSRIENYLGFPAGLTGADLTRRAVMQARRFGVEILAPMEASRVRVEGPYKIVELANGTEVRCHVILIATGVRWRKLDVPGMDRLSGAGIYYGAAMTEAIECRGQTVYLVGGANSAGQAAVHFAGFAERVVMLVRGDTLKNSMSQYLIDRIRETPNISVEYNSRVVEVHGTDHLEAISIHCTTSGQTETVPANYLFIFIGATPHAHCVEGIVESDERGFILSGPDLLRDGQRPKGWQLDRDPVLLETSVPGIFVVGDVRHGSVKRVASGVGEGSIAIQLIHQYLSKV